MLRPVEILVFNDPRSVFLMLVVPVISGPIFTLDQFHSLVTISSRTGTVFLDPWFRELSIELSVLLRVTLKQVLVSQSELLRFTFALTFTGWSTMPFQVVHEFRWKSNWKWPCKECGVFFKNIFWDNLLRLFFAFTFYLRSSVGIILKFVLFWVVFAQQLQFWNTSEKSVIFLNAFLFLFENVEVAISTNKTILKLFTH